MAASKTSIKANSVKSELRAMRAAAINVIRANAPPTQTVQGRFIESELLKHVPDIVASADHNKKLVYVKRFVGVLMFIDVSGFAALTERYWQNLSTGVDQLSSTLNTFVSSLVALIIGAKGDVLKFAGDGILSNWVIGNSYDQMKETIVKVISTALEIQENCGDMVTDVGVKLKLKIGVACGECCVTFLGNDEFRHYVTSGKGIDDVNNAERICEFGSIVVAPYLWSFCNKRQFEYTLLSDQRHIKIHAVIPLEVVPHPKAGVHRGNVPKGQMSRAEVQHINLFVPHTKINRKVMNSALEPGAVDKVKLYVPKPVLQKLDQGQLPEYLSEMRPISVTFVNLLMEEASFRDEHITVMDKAFGLIWEVVQFYEGCLSKILMFDKGCTMLVLFGIHCFKHDNDSARALQCGNQIQMILKNSGLVKNVSVGVTTGPTFCGVVGHELRREYAVLGRKVNMAARLMSYYPGRVTCDNDTFLQSKITRQYFKEMIERPLKGLSNVGTVREYSEELKEATVLDVQQFDTPLLDRENELDVMMKEINRIKANPNDPTNKGLVIFEGENGMGKSHMLDTVISMSEHVNVRAYSCAVSMNDSLTELYVIRTLLMGVLNMDAHMPSLDREAILVSTFFHTFLRNNFYVLNELLSTKFRVPILDDGEEDMGAHVHNVLLMMFEQLSKDSMLLLLVDDGHFIDDQSWKFITELNETIHSIMFVVTIKHDIQGHLSPLLSAGGRKIIQHKKTMRLQLKCLEPVYYAALACQILDVCAIPSELEEVLKKRSQGKPIWVETMLKSLYSNGDIQIIPKALLESTELMSEFSFVTPNSSLLKRRGSYQYPHRGRRGNDQSENMTGLDPRQKICVVTPGVKLLDTDIPETMKCIILASLDGLPEPDKTVLKCGAIIGEAFTRDTLLAVMPNTDPLSMQSALDRLFDSGLLECEKLKHNQQLAREGVCQRDRRRTIIRYIEEHAGDSGDDGDGGKPEEQEQPDKRICFCNPHSQVKLEGVPWDSVRCARMRFSSTLMQDTAYRTFSLDQRRAMHAKIALYLDDLAHKCSHCGGGEFLTPIVSEVSPLLGGVTKKRTRMKPQRARQKSKTLEADRSTRTLARMVKGPTDDLSYTLIPHNQPSSKRSLKFDTLVSEMDAPLDEVDLRDCTCIVVLNSVFPLLVYHCERACDPIKMIDVCSQAAVAAIQTQNPNDAIAYLQQAEYMMKGFKQGVNMLSAEQEINPEMLMIESEARVHALFGLAYFHMGLTEESLPRLNESLRILGKRQPSNKLMISMMLRWECTKQNLHTRFPASFIGTVSARKSIRYLEATHSLCYLFQEYYENNEYTKALLAAMQEVNLAEESNEDLHELIVAYTNVIQACFAFNWLEQARKFEKTALSRCAAIIRQMDPDDFVTISHLFIMSLRLRLSVGKLKEALDSGDRAYVIADKIHDNSLEIDLFPLYSHTLAMCGKNTYADILKKLDVLSDETKDVVARCWYYACSLFMTLETGFQLQEVDKCIGYAVDCMEERELFNKDSTPLFCLFGCLATWFARRKLWQETEIWFRRATSNEPKALDSFLALSGLARIVECELIACASSLADRNCTNARISELKKKIVKYFARLETSCQHFTVLQPRYYLLLGYWKALQGKSHLHAGEKELQRCIKLSSKMGNEMDMMWAQQIQASWMKQQDPIVNWLEYTDPDNYRCANHIKPSDPIRFTLPLPYLQPPEKSKNHGQPSPSRSPPPNPRRTSEPGKRKSLAINKLGPTGVSEEMLTTLAKADFNDEDSR